MFESICIRGQKSWDPNYIAPFDLGFLAEAMLFYQNVRVIITDREMLKWLVVKCQPSILLELLESGCLKISYLEDFTGIYTTNTNAPHERHKPTVGQMPHRAWQTDAPKLFAEAIECSIKGGKRFAKQFSKFIEPERYDPSVPETTLQDFSHGSYVRQAIIQILKYLAPEYQIASDFIFEVSNDGSYLAVETNIDFRKANDIYHRRVPASKNSLSASFLLSLLVDVRGDWYFSSHYSSEIATDSLNSTIIKLKFADILKEHGISQGQLQVFQDFTLDNARAVREVINTGERDFADLQKLLSSSSTRRFRQWLKEQPEDISLLKEYFHEVTKSSWVDKLPSKSMRWAIFNAVGLSLDALGGPGIGKVLGLALSAGDEFLLDKLIKGWKPNQFIEQPLKQFVRRRSSGR
jgi:hypothetical protein